MMKTETPLERAATRAGFRIRADLARATGMAPPLVVALLRGRQLVAVRSAHGAPTQAERLALALGITVEKVVSLSRSSVRFRQEST